MVGPSKFPTKAERERMDAVSQMPCICCAIEKQSQPLPTEVDHSVANGYRRLSGGHMATIPLCRHHHRGVCLPRYTPAQMYMLFGPNKRDHRREFKDRYGDDEKLIKLTNERLGLD